MEDTPITVRKYTDFDEMKADEYRYWQSRPVSGAFASVPTRRLNAVRIAALSAYAR